MSKNKTVILYYLASPKTGGWITYIIHLMRSLKAIGYPVMLAKISKKESIKPFFDEIMIRGVPLEMAHQLNKSAIPIIVAMELKDEQMLNGIDLINNGCDIIHHGMGQTPKDEFFDKLKRKPLNFCVRKSISDTLTARNIEAHHLRQPFLYEAAEKNEKSKPALSLSRIDFVKKTEVICAANAISPLIDIYGSENGLYTNVLLDKKYPGWRAHHKGEFKPLTGSDIAKPYRYLVDLTQIKNDGGEMQYTFMEAIVAGCGLILNKRWGVAGGIFTNENCHFVETEKELIEAVKSKDLKNKNNFDLLRPYQGTTVAKRLVSFYS